jgi:hypothetical protein
MRYFHNLVKAAVLAISAAGLVEAQVTLQAAPAHLSFSCEPGVTALPLAPQTISISSSPTEAAYGTQVASSSPYVLDEPWVSVTPAQGVTPSVVSVSVDPSIPYSFTGAGNYSAIVWILKQDQQLSFRGQASRNLLK